jgi:hypothetical protein
MAKRKKQRCDKPAPPEFNLDRMAAGLPAVGDTVQALGPNGFKVYKIKQWWEDGSATLTGPRGAQYRAPAGWVDQHSKKV